jgi:hypothetical protein
MPEYGEGVREVRRKLISTTGFPYHLEKLDGQCPTFMANPMKTGFNCLWISIINYDWLKKNLCPSLLSYLLTEPGMQLLTVCWNPVKLSCC